MKKALHKIEDVDKLREVTRLLANENEILHKQLQKLSREMDTLKGQDSVHLQLEIKRLKQALNGDRRKYSQKKSERTRPHRRSKKNGPREDETGGRRTAQPELEHIEELFELSESDKVCDKCNGIAEVMEGTFEESEVIDEVQRTFRVIKAKRQKAVHQCDCSEKKIVVAKGPEKAVTRGRFSLGFAISVVINKYFYHIPLEAQASQMADQGLIVKPNVLWNQIEHQAKRWQSTYEALRCRALESPCVNTDDTGWPMLELGRKNWQAFVLSTDELTYIEIGPRKDHQRVMKLLTHPKQGYYSGVLMCDGAANFTKAQKEMKSFVIANDWAHVRRKFVEAAPDFPVASEMVELIGELFEIERNAKESELDLFAARIKVRTEFSLSILEKIRKWMQKNAGGWQGSNLNRAIKYTDRRWEKLTYFAGHPEVPLHNNPAEFALRKPVRGRKNFHGSKSPDGAKFSAMAYTLCETARKHGLDPGEYLRAVFLNDLAEPGRVTFPEELLNI